MTVVIGTAGHIDHGKTSLLRALTGIDADRLPEERRRGMTIDVGYAHLRLADGDELDFVDVPGHDKLVGNMLVGAGEIDAALVVVAADDGPRAQTLEHLELLDGLGIDVGVVAVTKIDVVDAGRVAEVVARVEELLGRDDPYRLADRAGLLDPGRRPGRAARGADGGAPPGGRAMGRGPASARDRSRLHGPRARPRGDRHVAWRVPVPRRRPAPGAWSAIRADPRDPGPRDGGPGGGARRPGGTQPRERGRPATAARRRPHERPRGRADRRPARPHPAPVTPRRAGGARAMATGPGFGRAAPHRHRPGRRDAGTRTQGGGRAGRWSVGGPAPPR